MSDPTDRLRELIDASTQGERSVDGCLVYGGDENRRPPIAKTSLSHGLGDAGETDKANARLIAVLTSTDVARAVVGMREELLLSCDSPALEAFDAAVLAALERIDHE